MSTDTSTIAHIGLGKTATTTLQRHLFPKMCQDKNYSYNPTEFQKISQKGYGYSAEDKASLQKLSETQNILVSNEGLLDWDPNNWTSSLNRVLDIFGPTAKIIVTVRDPVDYMSSVFIQRLHEGNIVNADDFFVSSLEYERLAPYFPTRSLLRYDYEKLDYARLKLMCESKFNDVYLLPMSRIASLYPFKDLLCLTENEVQKYRTLLKNAPTENRAFSNFAVNLTFKREKILNFMNLKSIGSEDPLFKVKRLKHLQANTSQPKASLLPFRELNRTQKLKTAPHRILRRIKGKALRVIYWRWCMQSVVDKLVPYKKYRLPEHVLRTIDCDAIASSRIILREIEAMIDHKKV